MATKMVKASMGLGHEKQHIESRLQQQNPNPHPHPQLEELVNTIGLSLVQEFVQYLKGPEGEAALETILERQARVVSRLAITAEAREAARVAASEAIGGSYDAVERKRCVVGVQGYWLRLWGYMGCWWGLGFWLLSGVSLSLGCVD